MRAGAQEGCPHEDRYLVAEADNGAASRESKVKAARKGRFVWHVGPCNQGLRGRLIDNCRHDTAHDRQDQQQTWKAH